MAYDNYMADRVADLLLNEGVKAERKKLMGGLCFVLDDKMCLGVSKDKVSGKPYLIARIGVKAVRVALAQDFCHPFQPAGRVMQDFVMITEDGIESDEQMKTWIQKAITFNPLAKSSKR